MQFDAPSPVAILLFPGGSGLNLLIDILLVFTKVFVLEIDMVG
jgi:hypothetical protein